ncbi:hypothetical protein, partial [Tenacibaculum maritimum]|uniref:hypothetical protein n=1 Tax=Tenacibaculum maritimum TaxID=107401 RepID=UPI003BB06310
KFLVFQRTKDTAQNEQHLYFKLLIISKKQNLFFISAILLHYQEHIILLRIFNFELLSPKINLQMCFQILLISSKTNGFS